METARAVSFLRQKLGPKMFKVFTTLDNVRMECNTKDQIKWACINENKRQFFQSQDTPPMDPNIIECFGCYAGKKGIEGVLEGFECLDKIKDQYLRMVLEAMQRPNVVSKEGILNGRIALEEHCRAWKKQKRRTSSERSQLNFNSFKATSHNKRLSTCDMTSRQIPYIHGFIPEPHKNFTDFQILKKAQVFDVEK